MLTWSTKAVYLIKKEKRFTSLRQEGRRYRAVKLGTFEVPQIYDDQPLIE